MPIPIGFQTRLFSGKRTAAAEIAFAGANHFGAVQLRGREDGLDAQALGDDLETLDDLLQQAGVAATLELMLGLDANGRTAAGKTPLDILDAHLPAIDGLRIRHVHWHLYPLDHSSMDAAAARPMEDAAIPQIAAALSLAQARGFAFGVENNSPEGLMFVDPERCAALLDQVPGLQLVWDLNHTLPGHLAAFQQLAGKMCLLHVSDTRRPETNDHLPLGMGSIDFEQYCRPLREAGYSGPAIFEIGGLPKSGGFGRDTDEALVASRERLQAVLSGRG